MASRLLTINIRKYLSRQPRRKRPMRIAHYVRRRIAGATNVGGDSIKISKELNSIMLKENMRSMKPLKVSISIENGIATVTPFEVKAKPAPAAGTSTEAKDAKPKEEKKAAAKKPSGNGAEAKAQERPKESKGEPAAKK